MSDSQQQQQQQQEGKKLALADLRSVRWISAQPVVRDAFSVVKPRYLTLKQAAILGWFVVFNEMVVVWWWTFLHHLPWPKPALSLLDWTDSVTLRLLDFTQQRLEWQRVRSRPRVEAKEGSMRRGAALKGDQYEDEDTEDFGDDYHSDTSTDSKPLAKTDPQGLSYARLRTTDTAEGRLREAMYHRVKKELRLMRRNSIRISYGIVNYGRQIVEPYMLPYVESFQVSFQKWARDHEIPELMMPLQEVWNSESRPLAKLLPLVRALFVVYLAFLLRLVKGKKSRRTRSMRSESLRRRAQNLTCPSSTMPLSPSALQQSSEPTPSPQLEARASLRAPAPKDVEEGLDGSLAKDSALGSECNHSDASDSDQPIAAIEEGDESDDDDNDGGPPARSEETASYPVGMEKDSGYSDAKNEDEEVSVRSTPSHKQPYKMGHKFRGKKFVTIS